MKEITHKQKNLLIIMSSLLTVYILLSLSGAFNSGSYSTQSNPDIIVYKSATCGCCDDWIDHLEDNNFIVPYQGSGKSLEMEWYTAKVLRHPKTENPTVVVVTDATKYHPSALTSNVS